MRTRIRKITLADIDRELSEKSAKCWLMTIVLFFVVIIWFFILLMEIDYLLLTFAAIVTLILFQSVKGIVQIKRIRKDLWHNPEKYKSNISGDYAIPNINIIFLILGCPVRW